MARTEDRLYEVHLGLPVWLWAVLGVGAVVWLRKRQRAKRTAAIPVGFSTSASTVPTFGAPIYMPPFNPKASPANVTPSPSTAISPLVLTNLTAAAQQSATNTPVQQSAFNQSGGFGAYMGSLPPNAALALASLGTATSAPSNPAAVDNFNEQNRNAAQLGLPHFTHDALEFEGMNIPVKTIEMLSGTPAGQQLTAGYLPAWYAAETGTLTAAGVS